MIQINDLGQIVSSSITDEQKIKQVLLMATANIVVQEQSNYEKIRDTKFINDKETLKKEHEIFRLKYKHSVELYKALLLEKKHFEEKLQSMYNVLTENKTIRIPKNVLTYNIYFHATVNYYCSIIKIQLIIVADDVRKYKRQLKQLRKQLQ